MSITKSVFYNNNKGLENLSADIQLTNSLFLDNFIGATFISNQVSKVEHCEFDRNDNSSLNIIGNELEVLYNNFNNDNSCSIYIASEYAGSGASYTIINRNNFIVENLALSQQSNPIYFGTSYRNYVSINANDNYWGSVISVEIASKIYDSHDDVQLGEVDYTNYAYSRIIDAGF